MHLPVRDLLVRYQRYFNLENATFLPIIHQDATVAIVYKVTQLKSKPLILKICTRPNDYAHEVYFLKHFASTLPVPKVIKSMPPENGIHGALLMECLPGSLVNALNFTNEIAFEIGSKLALIHSDKAEGYGDLLNPENVSDDPRIYFTMKFKEGLAECSNHLPQKLIKQCDAYFERHLDLVLKTDGPCITHRDFRAGNVIVNDGKLLGIIDWSSARAGFAEEDFCFLEHDGWPTNAATKASFLRGYACIRPVPDYSEIMPLLRLSRAIAVIGFALKREIWQSSMACQYQFNRQFLETLFK